MRYGVSTRQIDLAVFGRRCGTTKISGTRESASIILGAVDVRAIRQDQQWP